MATHPRTKWTFFVLLALAWTLAWGATAASANWPSPPLWPTASPTPTPAALDEETLGRLVIFAFFPGEVPAPAFVGSRGGTLQLVPGGSLALTLGYYECCYFFQPVEVNAVWSVAPSDGVTIDPVSGLLIVDPAASSGAVHTISADVENGRRIVSIELHVFTPEANPLVGYWVEIGQIDCSTGGNVGPTETIQEFIFNADGTFSVTWFPFEVYKDYWGTYSFDPGTGEIELVIENGNYIPADFDGSGHYEVDGEGRLVLTGIWLGIPPNGTGNGNCGHIFA